MAPKLYYAPYSPPARSVLMTADYLGLKLDLIEVDMFQREHLKPEYIKMNPQHTVPTLDDDGFIVWDSHAINAYLVEKYGKDDSLYPKDLKKRAIVNQRLHFDSGVLYLAHLECLNPVLFQKSKEVSPDGTRKAHEALGFLNTFLEKSEWVAGDQLTIADFNIAATASALNMIVFIDANTYPNIAKWFTNIEKVPSYQAGRTGLEQSQEFFAHMLNL